MSQHVYNGRAICADEAKAQIGCRPEYEVSPSLANVCKFIPPPFVVPSPIPCETGFIVLVFAYNNVPVEIKDVEK